LALPRELSKECRLEGAIFAMPISGNDEIFRTFLEIILGLRLIEVNEKI
jgi:hypothetical protein